MKPENRRSMERYNLKIPAKVRPCSAPARAISLSTSDVSAGGAYFLCTEPLEEKTRVYVSLFLLPKGGIQGESSGARVRVQGTVVRTDGQGMAIRFDRRFRMTPLSQAA
ncbi:MAG: PilZ domain-containing protein [Proteobacteria bacterium]|nr:PilZ domain-containing protein [Pseudomonadota bacterium]